MLPGPAMKRPWAKIARTVLPFGGTVLLLAWVATRVDSAEVKTLFREAQWGWLVLAALLVLPQIFLTAWRWRRISLDLGMPLSRTHATAEYGLSMLLNQVLPGGMAGDAIRVWRHRGTHGALGGPLRAAVVDRVVGNVAHVVVTALGLIIWVWAHPTPPPTVAWIIVGSMLLAFVCLWRWPVPGLRSVVADAQTALKSWTRVLQHAVVSIVVVYMFLLCFWCCAQALNLPLDIGAITASPLLLLALVLPISVGGWGLREASATAVLGTLGWSMESSVALSAAYGLVNLAGSSPAALVLLRPLGTEQ